MAAVLLFDGVCNFCNATVRFVIERDPAGHFQFAALQSEAGRELLRRCGLPTDEIFTMVLIEDGRCYTQSDAAVRVASHLSGAWQLLSGLRYLPRALRDWGYGILVNHRYQWFGKRDSCMVPTPELRSRFLA